MGEHLTEETTSGILLDEVGISEFAMTTEERGYKCKVYHKVYTHCYPYAHTCCTKMLESVCAYV